tara:strand:+ start:42 stop:263 length:222 start_codon:yes stop_codon:yes gene_type:complete
MEDYRFIIDTYTDRLGDLIYILDFNARDERALADLAKNNDDLWSFLYTELGASDGVEMSNGNIFYGIDLFDFM